VKASRIAIGGRRAALAPFAALVILVVGLGGPAAPAQGASCTATATSLAGVQYWVAGLPAGSTVCLANGSYGRLSLSTNKPGGGITIRPVTPGGATIAGASLAGSYLTLYGFVVKGDEVTVQPGSTGMTVSHNRITGGYFGVNAGPTTTTTVNDVNIVGNQFIGPFGEDAIRADRYHDGPDADSAGLYVFANEFTNIRENGNHSDCFQSVWVGDHLYFVGNYLHDNRCQGFFVKDQASTVETVVVNDNLFVRNNQPCVNVTCGGGPAYVQLFGPINNLSMVRNTVWGDSNSVALLRGSGWGRTTVTRNVFEQKYSDTSQPFGSNYSSGGNIYCNSLSGTWPDTGFTRACNHSFVNPYAGDYRIAGNLAGVDWKPSDLHFGP
jgi:hypothetical protein